MPLPARARMLPVRLGYVHGPRLMSRLRMAWARLRHPHTTLAFGPGTYLGPGFSLHAPYGGTFTTGAGVELRRGFRAELAGPAARISLGAGSVCTYDVVMQCSSLIEVGERCMFGQATLVVDGNHRFRDPDVPMLDQGYDLTPIHVGDDATVTTKCTIIADVGRRAFVGANSVVTRPVPPFTVVAGVPAKVIDAYGPAARSGTSG